MTTFGRMGSGRPPALPSVDEVVPAGGLVLNTPGCEGGGPTKSKVASGGGRDAKAECDRHNSVPPSGMGQGFGQPA